MTFKIKELGQLEISKLFFQSCYANYLRFLL